MKILSYIVPKSLHKNDFILSLAQQADKKGKLTPGQIAALEDMIGVTLDFYDWDFTIPEDSELQNVRSPFEELMAKLKRDRFRKEKTRNTCIRAVQSIVDGKPNWKFINKALGLDYNHWYRRY